RCFGSSAMPAAGRNICVVEVPGADQAVPAVVALAPADHHRAATPQVNQHFRGAAAGILHQHDAGNAQLFDGPPVEVANFLTAEIHGYRLMRSPPPLRIASTSARVTH